MKTRISKDHLLSQIDRLNRIARVLGIVDPTMPHLGAYSLSQAYGGYSLRDRVNTRDTLQTGHIPARALSERIEAYTIALEHMAHELRELKAQLSFCATR